MQHIFHHPRRVLSHCLMVMHYSSGIFQSSLRYQGLTHIVHGGITSIKSSTDTDGKTRNVGDDFLHWFDDAQYNREDFCSSDVIACNNILFNNLLSNNLDRALLIRALKRSRNNFILKCTLIVIYEYILMESVYCKKCCKRSSFRIKMWNTI